MNEPPGKMSYGHKNNIKYLAMTLVPDSLRKQEWPQGNWWKIKGHWMIMCVCGGRKLIKTNAYDKIKKKCLTLWAYELISRSCSSELISCRGV